MAAAAGRFERTGLRGRASGASLPFAGFSRSAAVLRQPAGDARLAPHPRAVVRHHRPDDLQQPVHRPDGPAGRAALPVAALARGARRYVVSSPCRRAAAPRRCCASSTPRSPTTRSTASRRAACCSGDHGSRAAARHPHRHQGRPHVRLGNVNEDNVDSALPFPEIGAKHRRARRRRHGRRRHGAPLHPAARARASSAARRRSRRARRSPRPRSPRSTAAMRAPCAIW